MTPREHLAERCEGANIIRHVVQEGLRDVGSDDRMATFVASDETVDRYGDVVSIDGWDLSHFKNNAPFLWNHSPYHPIGTVKKVWVDGPQLLATVRFYDEGDRKEADELWQLVKKRQLKAVSVGFNVSSDKDYVPIRDENDRVTGHRFLHQELLELSLVPVPANPNALLVARSMNLSPDLVRTALFPDALVKDEQQQLRKRMNALVLAGIKSSAPR